MNEAKAVYATISTVMKEISVNGISKSRTNQQQGYSFRGIDDVFNAIAPILSKNGLVILPRYTERTMVERVTAKGSPIYYVTVTGELDFIAAVDGSMHTVRMYGEAMDSADKATNKAMSAAFKYACLQAFCIPTEGDNDADANTHYLSPVVSAEQAANITALVDEVQADKAAMLRWLGVDSITAIPAGRSAEVCAMLERKRAQG